MKLGFIESFSTTARASTSVLLGLIMCAIALSGSEPKPGAVSEAPKRNVNGAEMYAVGFDRLSSFPYTIVDAGTGASPEEVKEAMARDQVPASVRIYHEQRVLLTGYMMPLQIENGLAKKFVMMRDVNTCCYGAVPNMNDYVVVTMRGPGVKTIQDVPVELVGVFRIDQKYEGGYIVSLFVMEGEKFLGIRK